jgi:hypothetical protein
MDTNFLHDALRNWQERNHDARGFGELSPLEQSEIVRDAQNLKRNAPPITIDEVLENHRQHRTLAAKAAAEAKELQAIETMLAGRDAAIRAKYPIIPIPRSL